jgi:hypothetical protein
MMAVEHDVSALCIYKRHEAFTWNVLITIFVSKLLIVIMVIRGTTGIFLRARWHHGYRRTRQGAALPSHRPANASQYRGFGGTPMTDAGSAGMLRGWIMLWDLGMIWLLAAVVVGIGVIALIEVIAAIRAENR